MGIPSAEDRHAPKPAMELKLQALLNAMKCVEEHYGAESLDRVLAACRPVLRERHETGIAIEWHPIEEYIEFLERADELLGRGDGGFGVEAGAYAARQNLRGMMKRALFWVMNPSFLMRRAMGFWRQFNSAGSLELRDLQPGLCRMEVKDLPFANWTFCNTFIGWAEEMGEAIGWEGAKATHPECRARGDARCIVETRWSAR